MGEQNWGKLGQIANWEKDVGYLVDECTSAAAIGDGVIEK